MSVKSYTYISFPGTAKDAFEYYHSIFGGELEILTYGQFPEEMASEFPFDLTQTRLPMPPWSPMSSLLLAVMPWMNQLQGLMARLIHFCLLLRMKQRVDTIGTHS